MASGMPFGMLGGMPGWACREGISACPQLALPVRSNVTFSNAGVPIFMTLKYNFYGNQKPWVFDTPLQRAHPPATFEQEKTVLAWCSQMDVPKNGRSRLTRPRRTPVMPMTTYAQVGRSYRPAMRGIAEAVRREARTEPAGR
jgi:hypothetical protein